jgi:hexosaminidase
MLAVGTLLLFASPVLAETTPPLVPYPAELRQVGDISLSSGIVVDVAGADPSDRFAAADFRGFLMQRAIPLHCAVQKCVTITLLRTDSLKGGRLLRHAGVAFSGVMHDEGYVILTEGRAIDVIAATSTGVFYGLQTIKQLVQKDGQEAHISAITVRDWPAMRYRAIDDDLSRGPIPTVEYQKKQIRTFAAYKLNIYSPYFENALEHSNSSVTAPFGGAMKVSDVKEIVNYAKQYHIDVIPEQEAFGHLHGVLKYEKFSKLSETPHGSVLAPVPSGSLDLIRAWFGEIVSEFPSPFIHIGADETFELGRGQTSALIEQKGFGSVYVDFLREIHKALQPFGKRLLFWGDVARYQPQLLFSLPKDMIAVPWWYDPQPQGFDSYILPFREAGMETWVAPGVNNWDRVYPNNDMALRNIQGFVRDGQRLGATGVFNTVWNDDGEGLFAADWYGVLFGAAAGWQKGESSISQFEERYGEVFHGDVTGKINQAQLELMAAHKLIQGLEIGSYPDDGSDAIFWVDPWSKDGQLLSMRMQPILHALRMHAENAIDLVRQARSSESLRETDALDALELGAYRFDAIGLKFQAASEIAEEYRNAYAHRAESPERVQNKRPSVELDLMDISDIQGRCQDLRNSYSESKDFYRELWLRENRPYALSNVLARYDIAIQLWTQRGDRFQTVLHQWQATRTLPTPEEIGLPAESKLRR